MMMWNPSMERCSYLLFLLAWLIPSSPRYTASGINIQCVGKEREALLNFRQGIEADKCGLLTSWEGQECCHWYGIHCSNHSGHVIGLDLRGTTNQEGDCSLEGVCSSMHDAAFKLRVHDLHTLPFSIC
uniref:Leucine-rich repeat-containing N-terminal plant-type domain-containing protein n=1 Tax=Opuntia streptacantha TaxID=393608 RepID=A0A7C9DT11_OPUST